MKKKDKPQRTPRYRKVHKVKTLRSRPNGIAGRALRSLLILCGFVLGFVLFFNSAAYSQSDKFGGIGVSVDIDSSVMQPYIVDILSGKPGAMAGLRSGDHIISINHWKTKGKSQEQVVNHLRGRAGSKISLLIDRQGKGLHFDMKRTKLEVSSFTNFTEALNNILKSGMDTFSEIRGKVVKEKSNVDIDAEVKWKSNLKLPGFSDPIIVKKENKLPRFEAVYFVGSDTGQVSSEYYKLVRDLEFDLGYTVAQNFTERKTIFSTGFTTAFAFYLPMKNLSSEKPEGSALIIKYEHNKDKPAKVSLTYKINQME